MAKPTMTHLPYTPPKRIRLASGGTDMPKPPPTRPTSKRG